MARAVLYHLALSHFNEKARWALDFKRVPHVRRTVLPGAHVGLALGLARTTTLPILVIDGEAIADSTAIIAELERGYPEPPLYPADPALRSCALAIEDEADETLGPALRRL